MSKAMAGEEAGLGRADNVAEQIHHSPFYFRPTWPALVSNRYSMKKLAISVLVVVVVVVVVFAVLPSG